MAQESGTAATKAPGGRRGVRDAEVSDSEDEPAPSATEVLAMPTMVVKSRGQASDLARWDATLSSGTAEEVLALPTIVARKGDQPWLAPAMTTRVCLRRWPAPTTRVRGYTGPPAWDWPLSMQEKRHRLHLVYNKEASLRERQTQESESKASAFCRRAHNFQAENYALRRKMRELLWRLRQAQRPRVGNHRQRRLARLRRQIRLAREQRRSAEREAQGLNTLLSEHHWMREELARTRRENAWLLEQWASGASAAPSMKLLTVRR